MKKNEKGESNLIYFFYLSILSENLKLFLVVLFLLYIFGV